MNCPSCGHENPETAQFCGDCGQPLAAAIACPACGTENPHAQKFCHGCGRPLAGGATPPPERAPRDYTPKHLADKILQSKSALEGERKQVTVLFADVKGSMELAEQVDPEEWHRILDRFFQILADGVHRFEGTVNQYTGDGIMALFGAPIAHEDHAQRACYAALHLRDQLRGYADELRVERGLNFSTRMGINSGEVVVGKIGDDLRMDYTAQGQTVGLASRIEQLAEPGRAYVTHSTAQLIEGFFQLRDLGQSKVKGLAELLHVYDLDGVGGARTRLDVSRARGFSKFVGREGEMQALEAALARSRESTGQVVGVVAEAGVGKSRLCYEFTQHCRARGLTVFEGRAVSHGRNVPFLPMLQVFRAYFGINERDDARTVREKIAGRLLLIDEGFREVLPLLFEFFGVPDPERPAPQMDPEASQRQLFGVLRRLVREAGEAEPGVTLIEDLHWMDGGSLGFLEQWVEAIGGARGLLLVNFRPEYHAEWMGKSYYQQLPLAPLGPEATAELVADLLGGDPSTEGLGEAIHARTAGNPFFTEEVVQSLVESGQLVGVRGSYRLVSELGALEVPATVQAVVAARIDRLAEREKGVLQAASVIGREFAEPVLEAAAELSGADLAESLRVLTGAEFLYEQSLYPVAEYAFKHPLTQEVAYGSQLGERRARVHASVARAIERLDADKLDERSALLAHHWEQAGEALEAARWYARAAGWIGMRDLAEAVRHWQRVRELSAALLETEETVRLRAVACLAALRVGGWRLGFSDRDVEELYAEGRSLAERSGNPALLGMIAGAYSFRLLTWGRLREALELGHEVTRLADESGDRERRAMVRTNGAYAHFNVGRIAEALELTEEGEEFAQGDLSLGTGMSGFSAVVWFGHFRAYLLAWMGRLSEAYRELERATPLAREEDNPENLGWARGYLSFLAELSGELVHVELGAARAAAHEAVEIAESLGSEYSRAIAYMALGTAHLVHGGWSEARTCYETSLEIARDHRTGLEFKAETLAWLARAQLGSGDAASARRTAEEAVARARERGQPHFEALAQLVLVRERCAAGGTEAEIEAALDRASALVEESGARGLEPQIAEARAELVRLLGKDSARERELREAHRLYTEMGATGHAKRLAEELGL